MRVAQAASASLLFLWFALSVGVLAQEMDLEALLDDLTATTTRQSTVASAVAPAAEAEEEMAGFMEEAEELVEPEAMEAPEAPEALDEVEEEAFFEEEGAEPEGIVEIPVVEVPAELMGDLFPEGAAEIEEAEPAEMEAEMEAPAPEEEADIEDLFAPEAAAEEMAVGEVVEEEAEMEGEEEASLEDLLGGGEEIEEPEAVEEAEGEAEAEAEGSAEEPAEAGEAGGEGLEAAREIAAQEEVRRQADEKLGLEARDRGNVALERGEYEKALEYFEDSLKKLRERPVIQRDLASARWGAAEADYRIALGLYRDPATKMDIEKIREANRRLERALERAPDHRAAASLLARMKQHESRLEEIAELPVPVDERPDVIEKDKSVEQLLDEGKQFFEIEDYKSAEALFSRALQIDEYNIPAMRFLKKIEERRYQAATREREASVAKAMRTVRETWTPPIIEEVELPDAIAGRQVIETISQAQKVQEKMARIMIPAIEFRQVNINDVVNFLVDASVKGDPEGVGVNIILNLRLPGTAEASAPAPQPTAPAPGGFDPFFEEEFGEFMDQPAGPAGGTAAGGPAIPTITLNLRRISLYDALKIITEVAGLRYRIEGNTVIITPAGYVTGTVVTRMYPVQPSIFDVIIEREESDEERGEGEFIEMGTRTTVKHGDVEEFFKKLGVPFPVGTSITYNRAMSKLIVANTPENLDIFERILQQLNVVPQQVEIEARFIEISQGDLEELGLEWMLTDDYEVAWQEGAGPIATRERVQVNADADGVTKGLRFFSFDRNTAAVSPASAITRGVGESALGGILSIATVLTNPEVSMILHALSQKGGSDLLSAPRVTTRAGVGAVIEVVREIIYPTEFEVTQPTIQSEGNLVTPPTVTPGGFETRETGVILNVTPLVTPDGYTIDLNLSPEVSELVDWIQYGSEFTISQPIQNPLTGLLIGSRERTFSYNIPQPVFSSRNVATSISIWDGQTVVMGGLIREELIKTDDKIPVLGDIPLLGRLFRTKGEYSQKRNLLIFVTARLVDPAGKPIHGAGALAMPGMSAEPQGE
ncbi:MAG: hypothetical protein JXB04_06700 [Kiritimatiellae bacterium]|nr:hypothetical protein [Kiritimatiellia bacterium]